MQNIQAALILVLLSLTMSANGKAPTAVGSPKTGNSKADKKSDVIHGTVSKLSKDNRKHQVLVRVERRGDVKIDVYFSTQSPKFDKVYNTLQKYKDVGVPVWIYYTPDAPHRLIEL